MLEATESLLNLLIMLRLGEIKSFDSEFEVKWRFREFLLRALSSSLGACLLDYVLPGFMGLLSLVARLDSLL